MSENNGLFIGMAVVNVIMLILNIIGNFLVIQAIAKTHRLRTASNFLVANLALCDLLSPLLNIPVDISVKLSRAWHYGPVLCRLFWPVATMMTTSSALTLVAISIDRSRALRYPFVTKLTTCQSVVIVLAIHVLSLLLILPYSVASVVIDGQCDEDWSTGIFTSRQYTLIIFHVQYLIPLIILTFVYCRAAHYLRRCTLSLVKLEECSDSTTEQSELKSGRRRRSQATNSPSRTRSLTIRREQNAHVMKMFAVVVTVFAFFTLPNNVRWLVDDFRNYSQYPHKDLIAFLCTMCTYLNCFANPIIYGTFSKDYKASFLRVLTFGRYGNDFNGSPSHAKLSRLPSSVRTQNRRLSKYSRQHMNGKTLGTRV